MFDKRHFAGLIKYAFLQETKSDLAKYAFWQVSLLVFN